MHVWLSTVFTSVQHCTTMQLQKHHRLQKPRNSLPSLSIPPTVLRMYCRDSSVPVLSLPGWFALLSPPPRLRGDVSPPRAPPSLPLYKAALIILWGKNNIKQPCDIGTKLLQFQSICKKRFKSKGQSIIVSCMCSIPWPCTKINEIIYFCTAVTMYCDVFLDKLRGPTNEYNESLYSSVKMGATIWSEPASRDVCTSYRTWYLFRTCIFPWHLMAALFSIIHRLYVILKPLEQPIPKGQHESTKHPAKADFRISFKAASKWWLSN